MKKFGLGVLGLLIVIFLLGLVVKVDPDERRPGLGLSGPLAAEQSTDWSFLYGRNKLYVEMATWYFLPHSITTTSWLFEGNLYVPCGRCVSKYWPNHVARNPDVRLQVKGELYDRRAVRLTDQAEVRKVMELPQGEEPPAGVWVYRMDPR